MAKKYPSKFCFTERIVRHIYSPQNINPKERTIKANFLQFRYNERTKKNELSCNRFEIDSIRILRDLGHTFERPQNKAEYFGFGCTSVQWIRKFNNYRIWFTPILTETPKNYSHCDIYDEGNPPIIKGEPLPAKMSYEREVFLKAWRPYVDIPQLITKELIQPPNFEE